MKQLSCLNDQQCESLSGGSGKRGGIRLTNITRVKTNVNQLNSAVNFGGGFKGGSISNFQANQAELITIVL